MSEKDILQTEITYLKGVGPNRAKLLKQELNIHTYQDLIELYPRRYVDRTNNLKIKDVQEDGKTVVVIGKVVHTEMIDNGRKKRFVTYLDDGTGVAELVWFQGLKWIEKYFTLGEEIAAFGKPTLYGSRLTFTHPDIDKLSGNEAADIPKILPVYPSTEKLRAAGLDPRGIRRLTYQLLLQLYQQKYTFSETLPQSLIQEKNLMPKHQAIYKIHFPNTFEELNQAKYRLKFEEFFYFQLQLAIRQGINKQTHKGFVIPAQSSLLLEYTSKHLPFELTSAQKRVIQEIEKDLSSGIQMNRLVQGDVGSGKTMVAFLSMLNVIDAGYQCAMMTPTEILAEQHFKNISNYAHKIGINVALLTGSTKKKQREQLLQALKLNMIHILIGTHALLEDDVQFYKLGLAVIDEQHRFGVMQRARLWQKSSSDGKPPEIYPHVLVMTATPIPRSLALTLYGDLDVSIIDELPKDRKPVKTAIRTEKDRPKIYEFIRQQIKEGRQAYFVYPLVEQSEKLDLQAVTEGYTHIQSIFPEYRVGLLHGKMHPAEKDDVMTKFKLNVFQILVATTVIEVGVDVPNASIMVIEHAERFGLAQLHQLRGRVGRGEYQSYCILMTDYHLSADGKKRLQTMVETNDGFRISDVDLEMRGPGEIFGTRQSGLPDFKIANISQDGQILQEARKAAFKIVEKDPHLRLPEHAVILENYHRQTSQKAEMSRVG
ncbi:MAG: ATP-dependent DNA helicase RecG [Bacteroidia bacterium]|nr:ATP-dependent DNA helicase RecG [Bacteroidia bacterium]MDW8302797.1 ATP-dependent DNA helicase RecG [Bacteroidia bacterium]